MYSKLSPGKKLLSAGLLFVSRFRIGLAQVWDRSSDLRAKSF